MNRLLSYFKQQQGLGKNDFNYDFVLYRLCVSKEDSWRAITPSTFISDFNPEPPLFAAKFASCKNYQNILALASEDGKIALQDITKKNLDPNINSLEGQQCHYNAIFDISWDPGQMRLVSASGDHTAKLWYVSESKLRFCRMFKGHSRSVKTVAFRKLDSAVFATGGRDGAILIWDTRASCPIRQNPKVDNCIFSGHQNHSSTPISTKRRRLFPCPILPTSITGLVFQDDFSLISCGAGDGTIKVWDIRRNYTTYRGEPLPKHIFPHKGQSTFKSFTNLLVDESGTKLYANCMDNTIYCYSLTSYSSEPLKRYIGLQNNTFYIKSCLSPDGNYLISGSSDDKAYIWNVNDSLPLVTLNAHTVEVTCVAWSSIANTTIVTCSDDARHNIWRIGYEKIDENDKSNYYGFAKMYEKTKNVKLETDTDDHIEENNSKKYKKNNMINNDEERLNDLKNTSDLKNNVIDSENNQENSLKYYSRTPLLELKPLNTSEISGYSTASLLLSKIEQQSQSEILSTSSTNTTYSPTMNLPNYVLNGEAPHLQVMSPKQDNKTNVDWLTTLRKKKLLNRSNVKKKLYHCNDKKSALESSTKTYQSSSSTLSSSTSYTTCELKSENNYNLVSDKNMKQMPFKFKLKNADCDQTKQ